MIEIHAVVCYDATRQCSIPLDVMAHKVRWIYDTFVDNKYRN